MNTLLKLTNHGVLTRANDTVNDKEYQKSEPLLWDVLRRFPENKKTEEIVVKVAMIDLLYATQLFRYDGVHLLEDVVKTIRTISDFDARVAAGDPELVPLIAGSLDKNCFSFASKYCCLHNSVIYNRDDYSIYDSSVRNLLPKYAKEAGVKLTGVQMDEWRTTNNYKAFNDAVDEVLDKAGITLENRKRKFDLFLWSQR